MSVWRVGEVRPWAGVAVGAAALKRVGGKVQVKPPACCPLLLTDPTESVEGMLMMGVMRMARGKVLVLLAVGEGWGADATVAVVGVA